MWSEHPLYKSQSLWCYLTVFLKKSLKLQAKDMIIKCFLIAL